jgi:hypothetical protein
MFWTEKGPGVLEKLIVAQVVKEFSEFSGSDMFMVVFTRARQKSLFWSKQVQSRTSYPISLSRKQSPAERDKKDQQKLVKLLSTEFNTQISQLLSNYLQISLKVRPEILGNQVFWNVWRCDVGKLVHGISKKRSASVFNSPRTIAFWETKCSHTRTASHPRWHESQLHKVCLNLSRYILFEFIR